MRPCPLLSCRLDSSLSSVRVMWTCWSVCPLLQRAARTRPRPKTQPVLRKGAEKRKLGYKTSEAGMNGLSLLDFGENNILKIRAQFWELTRLENFLHDNVDQYLKPLNGVNHTAYCYPLLVSTVKHSALTCIPGWCWTSNIPEHPESWGGDQCPCEEGHHWRTGRDQIRWTVRDGLKHPVEPLLQTQIIPEALVLHTGKHHAECQAGVELDSLGVVGGGGAWQAGLQRWQDLSQTVPLPHHQHRDQQRQRQTGTGASDSTRCVLTRVGPLRLKEGAVRAAWLGIRQGVKAPCMSFHTYYTLLVTQTHCLKSKLLFTLVHKPIYYWVFSWLTCEKSSIKPVVSPDWAVWSLINVLSDITCLCQT